MKKMILISALVLVHLAGYSQNMITKSSTVSFFSDALLEDIAATTTEMKGILNTETGEFVFKIPIQSFAFANDLMKEHFNENYLESEKYPNATFKGNVNLNGWTKETKILETTALGKLTIHGVEKEITLPVILAGTKTEQTVTTSFIAALADFKIEIPTVVFQKIAEQVEVKVNAVLVPMK